MDEPTFSEDKGIRYLHFGSPWIQGAMLLRQPATLVLEYTRQMMAWLLLTDPPEQIGILGLGAGSLARFCYKHTSADLTVVEWNPRVTAACYSYFRLPQDQDRLFIHHEDAGAWVANRYNHRQFPVLMVDLYDGEAQGPVRESLAFYQSCRKVVEARGETGVVAVNLFGNHESFDRNWERLQEAFDGRVLLLPEVDGGNLIALAVTGPKLVLDRGALIERAQAIETQYRLPATKWAKSLTGVLINQGAGF
ncbi:MAG: spermidine synthase [Pigmentiphaga sp.]